MNRSNDNGLSRAEFEYLYDTDNKEPETDKSPEYESLEWLKEVYYAYQEYRWVYQIYRTYRNYIQGRYRVL